MYIHVPVYRKGSYIHTDVWQSQGPEKPTINACFHNHFPGSLGVWCTATDTRLYTYKPSLCRIVSITISSLSLQHRLAASVGSILEQRWTRYTSPAPNFIPSQYHTRTHTQERCPASTVCGKIAGCNDMFVSRSQNHLLPANLTALDRIKTAYVPMGTLSPPNFPQLHTLVLIPAFFFSGHYVLYSLLEKYPFQG